MCISRPPPGRIGGGTGAPDTTIITTDIDAVYACLPLLSRILANLRGRLQIRPLSVWPSDSGIQCATLRRRPSRALSGCQNSINRPSPMMVATKPLDQKMARLPWDRSMA